MNRPTLIALCVSIVLLVLVLFGPRLSSLSGQVSGSYQPDVVTDQAAGLSVDLAAPFVCAAEGDAGSGDLRTTADALRVMSGEGTGHSIVAFDLKEQLIAAGLDPERGLENWQLAFDLEKWTYAPAPSMEKMEGKPDLKAWSEWPEALHGSETVHDVLAQLCLPMGDGVECYAISFGRDTPASEAGTAEGLITGQSVEGIWVKDTTSPTFQVARSQARALDGFPWVMASPPEDCEPGGQCAPIRTFSGLEGHQPMRVIVGTDWEGQNGTPDLLMTGSLGQDGVWFAGEASTPCDAAWTLSFGTVWNADAVSAGLRTQMVITDVELDWAYTLKP